MIKSKIKYSIFIVCLLLLLYSLYIFVVPNRSNDEREDKYFKILNTNYTETAENIVWLNKALEAPAKEYNEKDRKIFEVINIGKNKCITYSLRTEEFNCAGKRWSNNIAFFEANKSNYEFRNSFGRISFGEENYNSKPQVSYNAPTPEKDIVFVRAESMAANSHTPKRGYIFLKKGKENFHCALKMDLGDKFDFTDIRGVFNEKIIRVDWTFAGYDNATQKTFSKAAGYELYLRLGDFYFLIYRCF